MKNQEGRGVKGVDARMSVIDEENFMGRLCNPDSRKERSRRELRHHVPQFIPS